MGKRRTPSSEGKTCFVMMVRSEQGEQLARVVIDGLRTFGGPLRDCAVWVFALDTDRVSRALPGMGGVRRLPLALPEGCPPYPFVEKVYACAMAEAMTGPEIRSLVWLSLDCLIVNPPLLFDLSPAPDVAEADVAFRPVHHRNIGSLANGPLDEFWQGVYRPLRIDEIAYTVESFLDGETLRPYFNTHCFAFNPEVGLAQTWWAHFRATIADEAFQTGPCSDALHKIFLHQAILSTLVARELTWRRVRLLPPEYNYPLNLLDEMPANLRPPTLNSLVSAVYEDSFPWGEIEVQEPLRSWLMERSPGRLGDHG